MTVGSAGRLGHGREAAIDCGVGTVLAGHKSVITAVPVAAISVNLLSAKSQDLVAERTVTVALSVRGAVVAGHPMSVLAGVLAAIGINIGLIISYPGAVALLAPNRAIRPHTVGIHTFIWNTKRGIKVGICLATGIRGKISVLADKRTTFLPGQDIGLHVVSIAVGTTLCGVSLTRSRWLGRARERGTIGDNFSARACGASNIFCCPETVLANKMTFKILVLKGVGSGLSVEVKFVAPLALSARFTRL